MQYLGRKAELPNILRGVAELPPEQRGAVGKAANVARRDVEAALADRTVALEASELDARLVADAVDVTLPGDPPAPVGRLHVLTQTRREIEDVFLGLGFSVLEGPEVETVHYNFDALNHSPTHPARAKTDTFYTDHRRGPAHAHLADADPRDGGRAAAAVRDHPRARLPPRHRRDAHAAVPPGRGAGRRPRHHAGRPEGHAAGLQPRDLRRPSARSACARTSSRSPSRRSRSTSPASTAGATARRCSVCKGTGWLEILGAGHGRPQRVRLRRATTATTPSRSRASPSAWGSSGSPR